MTLQQLSYVLEIYRCGSISKAARNLYISQPSLSTALKELETELGMAVFTRTAQGTKPTPGGMQFIRGADELVTRFKNLKKVCSAGEEQFTALSVISCRSSQVSVDTAGFANILSASGQSFRLRLREGNNFDVINEVSMGISDIGILRTSSEDSSYFFQMAQSNELSLIKLPPALYRLLFSRSHPLAREKHISEDMLGPYVEIVYGDYEMPMYPFSKYNYYSAPADGQKKSVIFVHDRGSMMDMLTSVHGSYVRTTTTHSRLIKSLDLLERSCDSPAIIGTDAFIYDPGRPMRPEMREYINTLGKNIYGTGILIP